MMTQYKTTKRRVKPRKILKVLVYIVSALCLIAVGWFAQQWTIPFTETAPPKTVLKTKVTTENVMVVGGSMAYGWKDPNNDSYLQRAFQSLTDSTDTQYNYDNRATVGGSPVTYDTNGQFQSWLADDKPQIVVISWGLLNDVDAKTDMGKFNKAIDDEIKDSLTAHSVVIFVTSPVTQATATIDHVPVENYIENERKDAKSFRSPNVYFIDLNTDMANYLQAHGQTYLNYFGDSWHPDEAGHELAGELLYNQLILTFGTDPIKMKATKKI